MNSGLWEEVISNSLILAVIVAGLVGLGLYGNWRNRRERREDIRRAIKDANRDNG
jgi:uncharacterized protein (DUF2062 family)